MGNAKMADVSALAGVSMSTVSRVLNRSGYVAEEVRRRVEDAVIELGYVHSHKRAVARPENLLGVISLSNQLNPYFERVYQCLRDQAEASGYYCVQVCVSSLDNDTLAFHAEKLTSIGVCGIVICSFNAQCLEDSARDVLDRCRVPIVFLERTSGCYGFNRVLVDNKLGTYTAARHLINAGHTHLLYITIDKQAYVEMSRREGFLKAVDEASDEIIYKVMNCPDSTPKAAYQAVASAYVNDPCITGIIAWNDVYAAGVLHFLDRKNLRVPNDVTVIGYDNVLAPSLCSPISSVEMPVDEIAAAAVEIIDKSRHSRTPPSPRTVTLEPRLVIR